jgi:adenosylhomocysteine nucleosidase
MISSAHQQYSPHRSGCNTQNSMSAISRRHILMAAAAGASRRVLVLISANAEWKEVKPAFPGARVEQSPYGEYFVRTLAGREAIFFHGGWGKISAAATAEHALTRWQPAWVLNLGTCGGLAGAIQRFDIVLVNRTVVYDIVEQMGDSQEALDFYSTTLDTSWVPPELRRTVVEAPLLSADRDLMVADLPMLRSRYQARAVDWESGAIAWVAARHHTRTLILRGVTDLVGEQGGEAYGKPEVFTSGTGEVMKRLLAALPRWLAALPR